MDEEILKERSVMREEGIGLNAIIYEYLCLRYYKTSTVLK